MIMSLLLVILEEGFDVDICICFIMGCEDG